MKFTCSKCGSEHKVIIKMESKTVTIGLVVFGLSCDNCGHGMIVPTQKLVESKKKAKKKKVHEDIMPNYIG